MTQHECISDTQLQPLMDKLAEYAAGGWELVCSSYEPRAAYGNQGRHYLFIRRAVAALPQL